MNYRYATIEHMELKFSGYFPYNTQVCIHYIQQCKVLRLLSLVFSAPLKYLSLKIAQTWKLCIKYIHNLYMCVCLRACVGVCICVFVCVCVCVCLCVFIILEFRNQYYKVIRALSVFMLLNNSGTAGPIWLNGMALGQKK